MTVSCIADTVSLEGFKYTMSKENVAIWIVLFDLVISFYIWFALLFLKPLSRATERDIKGDTIAPNEFTTVIAQIPHFDNVDDLKAIYWSWAEDILEKEPNYYKIPGGTGQIDPYQNLVFNVNLGLSNVGYLNIQEKMGNLLIEKKKIQKQMKLKGFKKDKKKRQLTEEEEKQYKTLSGQIKKLQK